MKHFRLVLIVFLSLILVHGIAYTQTKHCDLEINIFSPARDSFYSIGDTAFLKFQIINYGPDSIFPSDTIYFFNTYLNISYCFQPHIPAGDSAVFGPFVAFYSEFDQTENDTFTNCAYLVDFSTTYVDTNQNNDTANCVTIITEGQDPNSISESRNNFRNNELNLYPNPAKNRVNLPIDIAVPTNVTVKVLDLTGRCLLKEKNNLMPDIELFPLNIAALQPGIYFVELMEGTYKSVGKLIIR